MLLYSTFYLLFTRFSVIWEKWRNFFGPDRLLYTFLRPFTRLTY